MSWRRLREGFRSRSNRRSSLVLTNGEHPVSSPRQSSDADIQTRDLPPRSRDLGGIRTSTIIEVGSSTGKKPNTM